jgi:AcrR family transcriptional regulator
VDSDPKLNTGRIKQKHRTRNALIEAAARLLRQGLTPSIEEVADAAQVSRATAYRYFPSQEQLLAGTVLLRANLDSEAKLQATLTSDDPAERLDVVVQAFHERFSTNEVVYRTLLSAMLKPSKPDSTGEEPPRMRASRHVHWLQEALAPVRPQLSADGYERLVAALAASTGFEAYTALRDISLLNPTEAREVMRWIAGTLLQSVLTEDNEKN